MGRDLDATIYYLKARQRFEAFVEKYPGSSRMPEILYLLGASYEGLRDAFGVWTLQRTHKQVLLELVSQQYPNTPWAAKATANLMRGRKNGIDPYVSF
jgi:TolA-binding protein